MNHSTLHAENKKWSRNYKGSELYLFLNLLAVQENEAYRDFDYPGLFTYAVKHSGLTEPVASMFRTVVNYSILFPALRTALRERDLTVAYASKLVSSLTDENIVETLEYAKSHSISETQRWLVREKGVLRKTKIVISTEVAELFKQVKDLVPGAPTDDDVMKRMIELYRYHHDPVVRAQRANTRSEQKKKKPESQASIEKSTTAEDTVQNTAAASTLKKTSAVPENRNAGSMPLTERANSRPSSPLRKPLTAAQKHTIHLRDQNQCTFIEASGERCRQTRRLHQHHVVSAREGGTNEPDNVLTLCYEHHDLVHQLSFPLEIQAGWFPKHSRSSSLPDTQPPPH